MYYGNRRDLFDGSNYCEYGNFRRKDKSEQRYQEYGDAKNVSPALTSSPATSAPHRAPAVSKKAMEAFDDQYNKFFALMKYCKDNKVAIEDRKLILDGKLTIEQYEAKVAQQTDQVADEVPEEETPVVEEAPVEEVPVEETKKKKSKKAKVEEEVETVEEPVEETVEVPAEA